MWRGKWRGNREEKIAGRCSDLLSPLRGRMVNASCPWEDKVTNYAVAFRFRYGALKALHTGLWITDHWVL